MARTLDPVAHAVRREAFLDAAQRLMQTKGYAQMSIGDVLDELSASKGAFYHYFDSKVALLDGVVMRMVEAAAATVEALAADPQRGALEKFEAIFTSLATFKAQRRELVLELLRVWMSDPNLVVRDKLRRSMITRLTPIFASIIEQGAAEGVFAPGTPEHTARVFVTLIMGANEVVVDLYYAHQAGEMTFEEVEDAVAAFRDALERILGARPGSLGYGDPEVLRQWFVTPAAAGDGSASVDTGHGNPLVAQGNPANTQGGGA